MGAQGRISDGAPVTRARGRRAHARGGQRRAGGSGETPEEQTTFRRKRVVRTRRILVHVVFLPGVGFSYAESGAQVDQTPAARNARPPACVLLKRLLDSLALAVLLRSEERRVGKVWLSTCRFRGEPIN